MDVDILERDLPHEFEPHHLHPGNPEEDDVKTGDQDRGGIKGFQLRGLVRPAERGERPEGGGEPGVEDIGVLFQPQFLYLLL